MGSRRNQWQAPATRPASKRDGKEGGDGHTAPARHMDEILHDLIEAADGEP
jgi:hypothetical protein